MEKDNTNIVNDSSLLSTEISNNTIHQEQEPEQPQQQPVHQIQIINTIPNLEEDLITLPEHVYSPSPPPQRIINPQPDNGIVEYKIPRRYKYTAFIRNKTQELDDEYDPQDEFDPDFDKEDNELIQPLNIYQNHSDIDEEDRFLTESDYFESALEGESEEPWDEQYDPFYKVKNYLNEIPKKEKDWHTDINKYYKFDENVGKYGAWVTVYKRKRIPDEFVYATKQKQVIKKNKRVDKIMEFKKHLISLYYPEFSPLLYSDKDTEYHKIWWTIMREKNLKKRYDKYKIEHGG
jgi:hypothetical protein